MNLLSDVKLAGFYFNQEQLWGEQTMFLPFWLYQWEAEVLCTLFVTWTALDSNMGFE